MQCGHARRTQCTRSGHAAHTQWACSAHAACLRLLASRVLSLLGRVARSHMPPPSPPQSPPTSPPSPPPPLADPPPWLHGAAHELCTPRSRPRATHRARGDVQLLPPPHAPLPPASPPPPALAQAFRQPPPPPAAATRSAPCRAIARHARPSPLAAAPTCACACACARARACACTYAVHTSQQALHICLSACLPYPLAPL